MNREFIARELLAIARELTAFRSPENREEKAAREIFRWGDIQLESLDKKGLKVIKSRQPTRTQVIRGLGITEEELEGLNDAGLAIVDGQSGRQAKEKRIVVLERILKDGQFEKIDGNDIDLVTANMLKTIHDALKPALQKKFDRIPIRKLVDFGWSMVK